LANSASTAHDHEEARVKVEHAHELDRRAAAMPNVLPPRTAGTLAALAACPDADVIFVAHTGLDRLVSVRDVWQSLLADMEVRARWWRIPPAAVPRVAGREAQVAWLYDWWERVDAWITADNALGRNLGLASQAQSRRHQCPLLRSWT
jgi:hypothetical protein